MKSFIRLPVFFLFSALCGWSSISSAGFAQVKVPGFQSGSGGYSYQGSSPANAGSFWTAGSIIVAGKTIDLGVAVPLAANMAEFAVGVARGNPAWIAAGAVAAWLLPYGIQWIAGQWQMVQSSVPVGSTAGYWYSNSWSSFGGACSVKYGPKPRMSDAVSCGFARWPGGPVGASGNCSDLGTTAVNCSIEHYGVYTVQFNYTANVCTGDQLWINGACQTPGSTSHPVTDAEWAEVKAHPVPDSVPDEIADHQPVPVQTPQIEPKVVPISQPYLNPQGQPVQDIVQITPAPEVGPDYVEIKTGTEALPSSTPIPDESDPNHPNVTTDPKEEQNKFCQDATLLDSHVRKLVGKHIHLEANWLGRKLFEWNRVSDPTSRVDRQLAASRDYKLPKQAFAQYKSAEIHTKQKRRIPKAAFVLSAVLVAVPIVGWRLYTSIGARINPPQSAGIATAGGRGPAQPAPPSQGGASPKSKEVTLADFVPRLHGMPETAPGYDEVRKVVAMPVIVGCVASETRLTCYTEQATRVALDVATCRERLEAPLHNPYKVAAYSQEGSAQPGKLSSASVSESEPPSARSAPPGGTSVIGGGGGSWGGVAAKDTWGGVR